LPGGRRRKEKKVVEGVERRGGDVRHNKDNREGTQRERGETERVLRCVCLPDRTKKTLFIFVCCVVVVSKGKAIRRERGERGGREKRGGRESAE